MLAAHVPIAALLAVAILASAFVRPVPDTPGLAAGLDGLSPPSALSVLPPTALVLLFDPAFPFAPLPTARFLPTALPSVALSLPALLAVLAFLLVGSI